MKKTTLKAIPKAVRNEVEERDNYTCIYCGREMHKGEGEINIAHLHSRNTHDNMRKENLVVLCGMCHQLQHQDLLAERRITKRMREYLTKLYGDESQDN